MKDCVGRDIKLNDQLAFTVGTRILTGCVVKIYEGQQWGRPTKKIKVALSKPEAKGKWGWVAGEKGGTAFKYIPSGQIYFRTVSDEERIILLKPLDNSEE